MPDETAAGHRERRDGGRLRGPRVRGRARPRACRSAGGCHGGDDADGRAPGLLRPAGERLRRRRLRRPGAHARSGVLHAVAAIGKTGVTRFLPTLITSSLETFSACARTIARVAAPGDRGHPHGGALHLARRTALAAPTPRAFVRDADVDDFRRRQDAAEGRIRLVTLAPEAPGVLPARRAPVASGVRVAIGHTGATGGADRGRGARRRHALDPPRQRLRAGAAAPPERDLGAARRGPPRWPASSWTAITCRRRRCRSMIRAKTPARSILVTDAIAAAGMPPGRYTLGGQEVELVAERAAWPPRARRTSPAPPSGSTSRSATR